MTSKINAALTALRALPTNHGNLEAAGAIALAIEALDEVKIAEAAAARSMTATLRTLSYSEQLAARAMLQEIGDKDEALVVNSKLADAAGITRSVFVSALRKLQAGGLVAARSLGMKGTHVRVLEPGLRKAV